MLLNATPSIHLATVFSIISRVPILKSDEYSLYFQLLLSGKITIFALVTIMFVQTKVTKGADIS